MDILEKNYPSQTLVPIMELLQFKDCHIQLVGTGSLKSQLYPADYDFLCKVEQKYNKPDVAYDEFKKILDDIKTTNNIYFIEFKFQLKGGEKHKVLELVDFTKQTFDKYFIPNKIDYCKIDGILTINGEFKEVSVIYFFSNESIAVDKYRQILLDDQKHYYDDGKYYKSLKRLMLASKYLDTPDRNLIKLITKMFNSQVGKLYQTKNMIDAVIIFMNKYNTPADVKKIKDFLTDIGLKQIKLNDLEKLSEAYGKLIDREGLSFYKNYNVPVGHLPEYNTIKGAGEQDLQITGGGAIGDFFRMLSSGVPLPVIMYRMRKMKGQGYMRSA
jgi:hypothetical protein